MQEQLQQHLTNDYTSTYQTTSKHLTNDKQKESEERPTETLAHTISCTWCRAKAEKRGQREKETPSQTLTDPITCPWCRAKVALVDDLAVPNGGPTPIQSILNPHVECSFAVKLVAVDVLLMIILVLSSMSIKETKILSALRWLGEVSYSFYLLHYPIIYAFTLKWKLVSLEGYLPVMLITLIFSYILYSKIERREDLIFKTF